MRRTLSIVSAVVAIVCLGQTRPAAVSIEDLIGLSRAGLSDELLEAVLEADPTIFDLDAETILAVRAAGLSERIILAMLRSGRPSPGPLGEAAGRVLAVPAEPTGPPPMVGPILVVIGRDGSADRQADADRHAYPPEVVYVPYPVLAPVYGLSSGVPRARRHMAAVPTRSGFGRFINDGFRHAVTAPAAPAQPVYWGWSGKKRPGSWDPEAPPR